MDLIDHVNQLAAQLPKQLEYIQTEEATKTALIMPFIQALGYNVFDPAEVVPEFVCDVGIKKGEKIDYAIMRDGKPCILIEAKPCTVDLDDAHFSQLYRYFNVTEARFGILTNGMVYRFFTDLDKTNVMDDRHFLEFDLREVKESLVEELKKFTKAAFDVDLILSTATQLKYTSQIRRIMAKQLKEPDDDFVRFFASQVYSGPLRQSVREQFREITQQAFKQFINEQINDRLKTALADEQPVAARVEELPDVEVVEEATDDGAKVETTKEELEAFFIVKSILREVVDAKRIAMRDVQSYCSILLDDNNRQPICRLRFNTAQKYIGLIDAEKKEERVPIDSLDDIYQHAERLRAIPAFYDEGVKA